MKPFAYFYNELLMVLEASGGCCESIIDGLEFGGGCYETICALLQLNIKCFSKPQAAAVNPLLMVWNLEEVAVKPFEHFYNEILMVSVASGGCCESIIDGLESRGGCCEAICILLQ